MQIGDNFPDLDISKLKDDDYPLVELKDEKYPKHEVYYVAKVIKARDEEGDFEVKYLRKSFKVQGHFYFLPEEEINSLSESNIKMHLKNPRFYGSTARQKSYVSFGINFESLNIR